MINVKYERKFKLWFYTVSHAQAIYRCVKDDLHGTQVDFLFKNINFISCPTSGDEIEINEASFDEARDACERNGISENREARLFILKGNGWSGYIIAGHFECAESNADFHEESELLMGAYLGRPKKSVLNRLGSLFERR